MSLKSRKNSNELNSNIIRLKIGRNDCWQDMLDLSVYDEYGKQYKIHELLEEILKLRQDYKDLIISIQKSIDNQNITDNLIAKSADLLTVKVSQLENEVNDIQDKTKYLE